MGSESQAMAPGARYRGVPAGAGPPAKPSQGLGITGAQKLAMFAMGSTASSKAHGDPSEIACLCGSGVFA